jgi:hypothetical protein
MLRFYRRIDFQPLQQLGVAGAAKLFFLIETPLFFGALYVFS